MFQSKIYDLAISGDLYYSGDSCNLDSGGLTSFCPSPFGQRVQRRAPSEHAASLCSAVYYIAYWNELHIRFGKFDNKTHL